MSTRIAVIGGGAAGCIAAITAAEYGAEVTIFERNSALGRKLLITGKGRCNITNNCAPEDVLSNTVSNPKFIYSAVHSFPPAAAIEFFERIGVPLKTERGGRVFPQSDSAADVVAALRRRIEFLGIKIITQRVRRLDFGRYDKIILATGGLSYPKTGSDGDGYAIAQSLGHTVTQLSASLVPLTSGDAFCKEMQGFSLKNVKITLSSERELFSDFGEMQFTHFGVTGPLILSASAHIPDPVPPTLTLSIDLKPALDEQTLDARILRDFSKYSNREFRNALSDLAGRLMIPVLVQRSGIPPNARVNAVTKEQRVGLVRLLKNFTVNITGKRPIDEAVVTRGGVSVREVNPATMESKLVKNLYFAGEILDLDAYTGGFNLQIAWATGYAAGKSAAGG
ncbi:MAG: NAD(P)/FAD-dependent oxidoreductase [Oscillospiraceae bacterium]|jgi:predicted Rossmann fold flavoprotein|nr:NAD(P)/FAD-dependent oxidoreductase [Oscillospiraceae bacterium]